MVKLGQLRAIGYKWARIKLPFLRCWEQKQGTACDPCTWPQQGVDRPPKQHLLPNPQDLPHCYHIGGPRQLLSEGESGGLSLVLAPVHHSKAQYSLRPSSGLLAASTAGRAQGPGSATKLSGLTRRFKAMGITVPPGCLNTLTS